MYKTIAALTVTITVVLSLGGCKKSEMMFGKKKIDVGSVITDFIQKNEMQKDGNIVFQFNDAAWVKDEDVDIFISGSFFKNKNPNNRQPIDRFSINTQEIPFNGDQRFPVYFIQSLGNTDEKANWLKSMWGSNVKISLKGSSSYRLSGASEDQVFYVPEPITLQSSFVDNFIINTNIDNTISWSPDPENPNGKAYICVVYEGDMSVKSNPDLPGETKVEVMLEVPDNGSYTISRDQLDELPAGGRTTIAIGRGNYELMTDPNTGTATLVSAITYSSSGQ